MVGRRGLRELRGKGSKLHAREFPFDTCFVVDLRIFHSPLMDANNPIGCRLRVFSFSRAFVGLESKVCATELFTLCYK